MIRGNPCRAILIFVIKVTMQFVFFYNKLKLFEKCNIYYILYYMQSILTKFSYLTFNSKLTEIALLLLQNL